MPYISNIERMGIEKGIQQGVQQGMAKGMHQGTRYGTSLMLSHILTCKFGPLSDYFKKQINEAHEQQLMIWAERVLHADKIEDVFEVISQI